MPSEGRWRSIDDVRAEAVVCCRCDLCRGRTQVVFGSGRVPSPLMFVGEAPGREEDAQGKPFVGRAGELLRGLLGEAGIEPSEVWLTNIVRCRPTERRGNISRNRAPTAAEVRACEVWMDAECRFVAPRAIVCLGAVAANALISKGFRISERRGMWHSGCFSVPITGTYHPAYAMRAGSRERARIRAEMLADLRMAADAALSLR